MVSACAESATSSAPTTSLPPAEVHAESPQTVADTEAPEPSGVPGLDAPDPLLCSLGGVRRHVQALGIAESFGGLSSEQFAALELRAAPRLVEVAAAIAASLPPPNSPASARVVIEQRIGPYARRATEGGGGAHGCRCHHRMNSTR